MRDLLAGDAALRERWQERFALLMVDEFQDTNRLQLDVLEMLERDNLFAVGDEFQSIYGFRHADVTIFRDRARTLGEGGVRRLRANFRSDEELLDVLDGAFAPVFGERFQPLVAGVRTRDTAPPVPTLELRLFDPDHLDTAGARDGEPPVELLVTHTEGWDDVADLGLELPGERPWRRAEARLIAQRLREEVDRGRRPGEIAVLVRAAASLRLIEQALEERGLATYVVGGRGYWSQEQVRDGLAYLSVLANPLDEEALYAVLGLAVRGRGVRRARARRARRDGGRRRVGGAACGRAVARRPAGRPTARPSSGSSPCWRPSARGPSGCRPRCCSSAPWRPRATTWPCWRARAASGGWRTCASSCGSRASSSGPRAATCARSSPTRPTQDLIQAREGEAALESEGLDAVRLMTIHRAKGLEFPVVCVADLGRLGPGGAPPLLLGGDGRRVGIRLRTLGAPVGVPALDYEALAAERAPGGGRGGAAAALRRDDPRPRAAAALGRLGRRQALAGPARRGAAGLDRAGAARRPVPAGRGGRLPRRPRVGGPGGAPARARRTVPAAASSRPRHRRRRAAPAGTALPVPPTLAPAPGTGGLGVPGLPTRLSYSSLGQYARCGYRWYLQRVVGLPEVASPPLPPDGAAGDVATDEAALDPRLRGSLVHALLEDLDFRRPRAPTPEAVAAVAAAWDADLSPEQAEDVARLVRAFADSPLCGRLARARGVRREAPFAFPLEPDARGLMLHGVVDVVAHEDGGTLVVDYKTDWLGDVDPEDLVARDYTGQRLVYALAALREGAQRVEVAHCFLERPDAPAATTFTAADAPAIAERLVGHASGLLAGDFRPTDTPHRDLCATCPGRAALCSHPPARTLAPAPASPSGCPGR